MKYKNIIILADAGIGDFIWATSALSLIRQYDENIKITLVTCDKYIELIDSSLKINEIVTTNNKYHVNKNSFVRIAYKIFWSIKNFKYFYKKDICLILDISMFFTLTSKYLYRIKDIVGPNNFSFGYDEKNKSAKFYTKVITMPKDSDRTSYMMRYQILTRTIFPTHNLCLPIVPNTEHLKNKVLNLINKINKLNIVISPCGSVPWRKFDITFIRDIILKLNELYNITFFIVGNSKQEKEYAFTILNLLKSNNIDVRSFVGKTSLLELKEMFNNMDLLLTVDTGICHIAATTKIPIISVYGATLPENSGTISSNVVQLCSYRECSPCSFKTITQNFVCKNPLCIQDITSEMVVEKIKEILK